MFPWIEIQNKNWLKLKNFKTKRYLNYNVFPRLWRTMNAAAIWFAFMSKIRVYSPATVVFDLVNAFVNFVKCSFVGMHVLGASVFSILVFGGLSSLHHQHNDFFSLFEWSIHPWALWRSAIFMNITRKKIVCQLQISKNCI